LDHPEMNFSYGYRVSCWAVIMARSPRPTKILMNSYGYGVSCRSTMSTEIASPKYPRPTASTLHANRPSTYCRVHTPLLIIQPSMPSWQEEGSQKSTSQSMPTPATPARRCTCTHGSRSTPPIDSHSMNYPHPTSHANQMGILGHQALASMIHRPLWIPETNFRHIPESRVPSTCTVQRTT